LTVKSGKYVGKKIETGAKLLADQLKRPDAFGMPEIYTPPSLKVRLKVEKE